MVPGLVVGDAAAIPVAEPGEVEAAFDSDMFTPTTIVRYTGHENGAVYGAPDKQFDGRTHLDNLFICGTDQGLVGIRPELRAVDPLTPALTLADVRWAYLDESGAARQHTSYRYLLRRSDSGELAIQVVVDTTPQA